MSPSTAQSVHEENIQFTRRVSAFMTFCLIGSASFDLVCSFWATAWLLQAAIGLVSALIFAFDYWLLRYRPTPQRARLAGYLNVVSLALTVGAAQILLGIGSAAPGGVMFLIALAGILNLSWFGYLLAGVLSATLLITLYIAEKLLKLYEPVVDLTQIPLLNLFFWVAVTAVVAGAVGYFDYRLKQAMQKVATQNGELEARNQELKQTQQTSASASKKLAQITGHINTTTQQQAASLPQQVAAVQEAVASLRELDANSSQIANSTAAVLATTRETLEIAGDINTASIAAEKVSWEGNQAVASAVSSAMEARQQIADLLSELEGLTERGEMLEEFSKLIQKIAQETHLLSLNAAIEAAGAGHYGERFKAVASASRELARNSLNTSQQVRDGLGLVREAVAKVAKLASQCDNLSATAADRATAAGETIGKLVSQVNQTVGQSSLILEAAAGAVSRCEEIATAASQQRTASQEILITMQDISVAAQGQAKSLQIMAKSMLALDGAADRLDQTLATPV